MAARPDPEAPTNTSGFIGILSDINLLIPSNSRIPSNSSNPIVEIWSFQYQKGNSQSDQ